MKKLISILTVTLCAGCAMGINQSVATINGKTYLIEKNTYAAPFYLPYEWSGEPRFTDLEAAAGENEAVKEYIKQLYNQCALELPGVAYLKTLYTNA